MNSKETKSFLSQMQAAYPADLFFEKLKGREAPTIDIWSQALKEVELECATRFLADWMKTNNRVPAACDVYQFHKQELIDKRMRIESTQESYINAPDYSKQAVPKFQNKAGRFEQIDFDKIEV